jgi:hypothetical protein
MYVCSYVGMYVRIQQRTDSFFPLFCTSYSTYIPSQGIYYCSTVLYCTRRFCLSSNFVITTTGSVLRTIQSIYIYIYIYIYVPHQHTYGTHVYIHLLYYNNTRMKRRTRSEQVLFFPSVIYQCTRIHFTTSCQCKHTARDVFASNADFAIITKPTSNSQSIGCLTTSPPSLTIHPP